MGKFIHTVKMAGQLDIQFLGGIESKKYHTSLGGSCQLYTLTLKKDILNILVDVGNPVGMASDYAPKLQDYIDIADIDAVLLTHVHNDHNGRLPKFVKDGYRGPIFMTPLSAKLSDPIFEDAYKINLREIESIKEQNKKLGTRLQAAFASIDTDKKRKKLSEEQIQRYEDMLVKYSISENSDIKKALAVVPELLFDKNDILQTLSQIRPIHYGQEFDIKKGFARAQFLDAGHVPGSAQIVMKFNKEKYKSDKYFTITNTGDLGRSHQKTLLEKPTLYSTKTDLTIIEGTYGGRTHTDRMPEMKEFIQQVKDAKDFIVMPAFSLQRFQEMMHALWQSISTGKLRIKKEEKIYCTSPLASRVGKILFTENPEKYAFLTDPIFSWIETKSHEEYVRSLTGRKIIIAGGGMLQGGSAVKYVQYALGNPQAQIWFTGYLAEGTPAREILEKAGTELPIELLQTTGQIKAKIQQLKSFSSHADHSELVEYMEQSKLKKDHATIITHGGQQRTDLKQGFMKADIQTKYIIPDLYEIISINLENNKKTTKEGYSNSAQKENLPS